MKTKLLWLLRVIDYGFNYYFLEKPRGLDFSKRSKKRKTLKESTGYALTSKKSLKNILKDIPIDKKSVFFDIGSGKGGTLCFSLGLGFNSAVGLEYEDYLHKIAEKNIKILGLEESIKLIRGDALKFEDYYKYSHIFMFNMLVGDLNKLIFEKISDSLNKNFHLFENYFILINGGISFSLIKEYLLDKIECSELIKDEICPYRGNKTRVIKISSQNQS